MHRHGLLLTAVATVTVPGLLAILAVRGHENVAADTVGVAAGAVGAAALTGPFPMAPATARAPVRNNVAAVQHESGTPVTVLSRVTAGQQALGMRLLARAADAGLAMSYQGVAMISESGLDGSVSMISKVWHRGGGLTLIQTSSAPSRPAAKTAAASTEMNASSPGGVFGVTKTLVALLGKHYVALYSGHGSVARRPTSVIMLYRFDGSLAARYWLDRQTMVPLRRELFDTSDRLIDEDSFVQVQFGGAAGGTLAGARGLRAQSAALQESGWAPAGQPSAFLASLAGQGWRVPGSLSGGLPLYAAASASTASGEVVDLQYSDGLYVVSLFVQRGVLAKDMAGWRQQRLGGQQAWVSGRSVTWAGRGFVYTMVADAPAQTVTRVVGGLPQSASPGFVGRLGRGLARIASLIIPFA
ncbi:sigma-E factor regulatory protein RseB domain-containing protein [Trebonia kvetii]|nr:sigma-E factor regulatory protein RseB domain-containing protein [Trebonia kvetii]